ncbi:hypothetical protein SynA1825c_00069 [Synechococcus sp. A18-25c]|nr:hypothetical protein SynA1825c_00069 [Synechococcus sp. A18-25c]
MSGRFGSEAEEEDAVDKRTGLNNRYVVEQPPAVTTLKISRQGHS